MVEPTRDPTDGAPPREVHVEDKKTNWIPWLLLGLGLLALLFALSRCDNDRDETPVVSNTVTADPLLNDTASMGTVPVKTYGTSTIGTYLTGTEAAPRTFQFEQLNFDFGKSTVRASDQEELNTLAATLKQYPNVAGRIVGYADARGPSAANMAEGKARADSVKAALVASGIAATRLETASGGETDPVETNATMSGRAANRRTEFVVTAR